MDEKDFAWVERLLDYAKGQPFPGGFLIGAIVSGVLAYLMAKNIAFKGHDNLVKEWKNLNASLKKELKLLKQQITEKDQRLERCHDEIRTLKHKAQIPA